ncbi:peptide transporter PTR2-A [Decorospora gaudefroyi]|uniref:Peptide transporter PTR2-A n=1 Tax=Decorospora gaudefroyi TaxID=184978 RepID=A0A6A5JYL2_9PLEO|nr:peptide transporter PTR2-A [Decorospora gaudefroyi]
MRDDRGLRRVKDRLPWQLWVVAIIGFWERATFWGLTAPWQNYMEHPRHFDMEHTPGALGLGQTMATRIYCGFFILYFTIPLFIAPLADSLLGQYKTLVLSLLVYCLGCISLTVSSLPINLDRGWGLPGLILSLVLIGLGGGGSQATMRSFIANQYTDRKAKVIRLKSGEQVMTDAELTVKYIYNVYFWMGNVGALLAFPTVYIERHYGFAPAYGLGLGCLVISIAMLVVGKSHYVKKPHTDDVMIPAAKIVTCAARNGFKMERADPEYQLAHHGKIVSWSGELVKGITRGLGACRVLLAFIMFYICFDQMQNNLVSQASDMNTGSTPNDVLPGMNQVACILISPLVSYVLDPFLAKRRIYLKPITRITIGFVFITLTMLYATVVQHAIYSSPPCYDHPTKCGDRQADAQQRPNVWIQAPLYFLMAAGEVFAMTTAMEYAETHAPKEMEVLVQAIGMLITGMGSAIALVIAEAARDPYLTWFYTSLTCGMAFTAVAFWCIFRKYDQNPTDSPTLTDPEKATGDVPATPFVATDDTAKHPEPTVAQAQATSDEDTPAVS